MKRLVIISLMALFAYLQAGYFFHTQALRMSARSVARRNIRAELPGSLLEKFSVDAIERDIHWEEAGKEFWLHGELYDVVKTTVENGKRVLYCINDSKEKDIVEQQLKHTTQNAGGDGTRSKSSKYQFPDIDLFFTVENSFYRQTSYTYAAFIVGVMEVKYDPASPPPRV